MDFAQSCGLFNHKELAILNYCRLYLHVTTVSELFDASGSHIIPDLFYCRREPWFNPDPALVGEVLDTIQALAGEGRTMLLVTHEIGFAYHMATRVLFLAEGGIYEQGTPDEVLKNPRRPLTQAFIAGHRRFSF